ncbi:MAG TPA: hypothetical protein VFC63_25195 [Blastocatellia bacterium]|nr:hypothetical protein [Blastocatellia bacterium]
MDSNYKSIVIVGRSQRHKAWCWESWSQIAEWLNPILSASIAKPAVRSTQGLGVRQDPVRFGRLGWDDKSHKKWAHSSDLNQEASINWRFAVTEIWAPSWSECEREQIGPDVLIQIENPFLIRDPFEGQFNQFFHLASPLPFYIKNQQIINNAIRHISELIDGNIILTREAPWNVRGDSIQSAVNNHLHYTGMYDDLVFNISKVSGKWSSYTP